MRIAIALLYAGIAAAQYIPPAGGGGGGAPSGPAGGKLSGTYPNPGLNAACSDLSNGGTACAKNTGTSGNTIPLLDGANTWSATQTIGATVIQPALSVPAPTITKTGVGTTTWGYSCRYHTVVGMVGPSSETTIANQADTLDGTHVNHVTCPAGAGLLSADIYIATAGSGGDVGLITTDQALGVAYDDSTGTGDGDDPPAAADFSGGGFLPNLRATSAGFGEGEPGSAAVVDIVDSTSGRRGLRADLTYDANTADYSFRAVEVSADIGGNGATPEVLGILFSGEYSGSATPTRVAGGVISASSPRGALLTGLDVTADKAGNGAVTTMRAGMFKLVPDIPCAAAPCVANMTAIYIPTPQSMTPGDATNLYGILIEDFNDGVNSWAIKTGLGLVEFGDALKLSGDVVNPFRQVKNTQSATAPGAGIADLRWIAGTNAGTCKLVGAAGTSATEVTIIDNVGGGC